VLAQLPTFYATLGLDMQVETPVDVLEEVEFCQTHPVFDGTRWRMVRNFPSCLSKDATITHQLPSEAYTRSYLAAVGDCGLSLCTGLPVLQEYYGVLRRCGTPLQASEMEETGMRQLAKGLRPVVTTITPEARTSFYRAFHCLPDVQTAIEASLSASHYEDIHLGEPSLQMSI